MTAVNKAAIKFAALCVITAAAVTPVCAQITPHPATLSTHSLGGGVYWVEGGADNTGFIVGWQGVTLIDAQFTPTDQRSALAEVAKVTSKPVNRVIVTHADPDHVGGISALPPTVSILAQENTPSIIRASIADPNGGPFLGPLYQALAPYLPNFQTLGSGSSSLIDGVFVMTGHDAPAHTSADLTIYLPAQRVVFAGDLLVNYGDFPVVHAGGSSLGMLTGIEKLLALHATTYVPGHGPILSPIALQQRLTSAQQRRDQVKNMVAQGKTLAEVLAALPETQPNAVFPKFTQVVYEELTKGYPPAQAPWVGLPPF